MSKVRADSYSNRTGTGAPSFPQGINASGVVTATTFKGALTGNVTGDVTGDTSGSSGSCTGNSATATLATNASGLTGTPSISVATVSAAVVNTTGDVSIGGSLTVSGDMTTINSVELNIEDKLVGIASTSSPSDTGCDGAGLQIFGTTNKTFTWERDTGCFEYSEPNKFKGVIETVSTATTSLDVNGRLIVECDLSQATTFTHAMAGGAGGQIGIVSFKNMPADTGVQNGTTATIIFTQNSTVPQSGVGNTQFPAGIGTFVTIKGFENGALVTGINTTALVAASAGSASTVFLSNIASQRDFVSFFIHYNGGTNTTANSYQVYATKSGNFAQGNLIV